jgi:integrase
MSSVRKRTLPSGQIRWLVDYRTKNGERKGKLFRTKAEAIEYETRVHSEIAAGVHVPESQSVTLREAASFWLERARNEDLEESTIRQYQQHLAHHILPELAHRKLCDLTKPAIEAFRDTLLQDRSRPLTRAVLTSLKGILKEAQRRGLVGQNVAAETAVKTAKRHKKRVEIPARRSGGSSINRPSFGR